MTNPEKSQPSIDDIQDQRLGGLRVDHRDIDQVLAERAGDYDDGIPLKDPDSIKSPEVQETEAAIKEAINRRNRANGIKG